MSLSRKAINFDLSTEALKKHFNHTAEAYNQIKNFMLDNGFEHRQYSGYASKEVMSDSEIASFAEKLNNKFSWLSTCIQEFDVTDIGEQYDLMHLLTNNTQKDKITAQDLRLENKQDLAMKSIKERINELETSGKLTKYTSSDKNKNNDKGR